MPMSQNGKMEGKNYEKQKGLPIASLYFHLGKVTQPKDLPMLISHAWVYGLSDWQEKLGVKEFVL